MSAPECGAPTKKNGQPCRRPRYHSCNDHGSTQAPTLDTQTDDEPIQPSADQDLHRYRDRNWQRKEGKTLLDLLGSTYARRLRGLKDCEDIAKVARFLDQAVRLEPGPLLNQVEALCGPDTADLLRVLTERLLQRLTGINSLKDVAKALRFAGIWHCAVTGTLATCPCLNHFQRHTASSLKAQALSSVETRFIPDNYSGSWEID